MSRLIVLITFTLLAVTLAIAEAHAQAPAYRSFKDWVIGCDNTRSCTALGLQPDDSGSGAFIQVERAGGGWSAPSIRLALFNEALAPGEPMTIMIDGGPVAGLALTWPVEYQSEEGGYAIVTLRETEITSFIDALRRGRRLTLADASGEGAEVSLEGAMAAALLFMDEAQGRVGTVTALVRAGAAPASAVPAPPPPPEVHPLPALEGAHADPDHPRIVRQRLAREQPDACEPQEADFANLDEVLPLGNDKELVSLLCSRGAYNFSSTYFLIEGGDAEDARPVHFPPPLPREPQDTLDDSSLTNGAFDPQSGRLGFFAKGRGLGDCGASGEYAWTGEGFILVSYQLMDACRGVPMDSWPVLWRADLR